MIDGFLNLFTFLNYVTSVCFDQFALKKSPSNRGFYNVSDILKTFEFILFALLGLCLMLKININVHGAGKYVDPMDSKGSGSCALDHLDSDTDF